MFAVAAFVLFIAAGAGVGGGPVLVPVYLLLGGFSQTAAVALSNTTIFGGSCGNVACNMRKRHPTRDRPLMDLDLLLLMEPTTMFGAICGSMLNKVLPTWVTHLLLALLLTLLTWRMGRRAAMIYRRETQTRDEQQQQQQAERSKARRTKSGSGGSQDPLAQGVLQQQQQQQNGRGQDGGAATEGSKQRRRIIRRGSSKLSRELRLELSLPSDGSNGATPPQDAASLNAVHAAAEGDTVPLSPSPSAPGQLLGAIGGLSRQLTGPLQASSGAAPPTPPRRTLSGNPSPRPSSFNMDISRLPSSVRLTLELEGAHIWQEGEAELRSVSLPPLSEHESKLAYAPPSALERSSSPSARDDGPQAVGAAAVRVPEAVTDDAHAALARVLSIERGLHWLHALMMVLLVASVVLTSTLSKSVTVCGSWQYWLAQFAVAPGLAAVWLIMRRHVLWKARIKWEGGYDMEGELRWTRANSIVFPAICTLAGIVAGMFGLGGAVVKTPLMLELGVHPQVTAATTQTMLLFTSATAAIVYAQLGDIPWGYAGVLAGVALCATIVGQLAIDALIRRVGRSSILVIVLVAFFTAACALSYYIAGTSIRRVVQDPSLLGAVGSVCGKRAPG